MLATIELLRPKLTDTLRTLIGFPTMNPPGGNEGDAQTWMASRLHELGLEVEVFDVLPRRPNVVGRLPSTGGGRSCLFNGHIDVVELGATEAWTRPIFDGVIEDGRMFGLGASDMKAAHAGMLIALEAIVASGKLKGEFVYESVVGEETRRAGHPRLHRAGH